MNKIKNFLTKNAIANIVGLFLLMCIQTCNKNHTITKLQKQNDTLKTQSISLVQAKKNEDVAKLIGEIEAYKTINNKMSVLNRSEQMMEFQKNDIIPVLDKKERELNATGK